LDILCATSLADEGLDLPMISRLFLVSPQKAGGRFIQRIGRAMRPHPNKPQAICFDFVDAKCGLLAHQARGRARAFANIFLDEERAA
jgi:superfamily II DNA or RNA helicase